MCKNLKKNSFFYESKISSSIFSSNFGEEVHKLYPLSPSDVSELANNAVMRVVNFIEPTEFRMVDESLDSYLRLGCVLMANVK